MAISESVRTTNELVLRIIREWRDANRTLARLTESVVEWRRTRENRFRIIVLGLIEGLPIKGVHTREGESRPMRRFTGKFDRFFFYQTDFYTLWIENGASIEVRRMNPEEIERELMNEEFIAALRNANTGKFCRQ